MHPVLLEFFGFRLHTYGAFMGLAFLTAMFLLNKRAAQVGISQQHMDKALLLSFIFGLLGARLLYVIVDGPSIYFENPLQFFKIWQGGLVFFGGFLCAMTAIGIFAHRHQIAVWKIFDVIAPVLALCHAIGRLGCFMAGCCYGKICHLPWAVTFTDPRGVGLKNLPLHPTQLYDSLFLIGLYYFLLWLRKRQPFYGAVFLAYLTIYPAGRSIIELFRNDFRGSLMGLSTAQWMSIPMVLVAFTWLMLRLKGWLGHAKPSPS